MVNVDVEEKRDTFDEVIKRFSSLKSRAIYVGIPADNAPRKDSPINNAELLYIHTHGIRRKKMRDAMKADMDKGMKYSKAFSLYIKSNGSPLWHAPPRPVIEPAIEANQERIAAKLKRVIQAAGDGDVDGQEKAIHDAGQFAVNTCRAWFTNPENGWPANSPATIAKKGSANPLIDTGDLRKAITYVVKEG